MHCHSTKQRRVSSLEPTKLLHAAFARKYVNYLVPALQNINKSVSSEEKDNGDELKTKVRYEVDMALVMSVDGFAWSHAMKDQLQTDVNGENFHFVRASNQKDNCIIEENVNDYSLPMTHLQKPLVHTKSCTNPICKPKNVKLKSSRRLRLQRRRIKESAKENEEEEKQITCRLANLRKLLPGENVMGVDDMVTEVGSYLVCLELQVNILKALVETH